MYELAKSSRDKMKAKARSLAASGTLAKDQKVDSSDWSPAEPLNADVKTGMRPVSKRAYKAGGKVSGDMVKARADRKPRKSGGRAIEKEIGVGMANKDMKAANEQRDGKKHIGGMKDGGGVKDKKALGGIDPSPKRGAAGHYKKGGRTKHADGERVLPSPMEAVESEKRLKGLTVKDDRKLPPPAEAAESARRTGDTPEGKKKGGRAERKAGGRAKGKGKTHINIMINAGRKEPHMPAMPPAGGPDGGGVMPVPMPPAAAAPPPAMPPMPMPPPPMGGGMPPMPPGRKAGGRITKVASSYKDMEAGSGGGEGRLQKTDIAKKHQGAPTRKTGGRAVKSYKDMTAGAASGPGRIQKTEMEKGQRIRGH